jgi:hypothetical protein
MKHKLFRQISHSNTLVGKPALCFGEQVPTTKAPKNSKTQLPSKLRNLLKLQSLKVPTTARQNFNRLYNQWKAECNSAKIRISSISSFRAQGPAFTEIVAFLRSSLNYITLLMEKLADPEEFMAGVIYDSVFQRHLTDHKSQQELSLSYLIEWLKEKKTLKQHLAKF